MSVPEGSTRHSPAKLIDQPAGSNAAVDDSLLHSIGRDQAVLIIGAGLIGTSIGLRLRQAGVTVFLEDRTWSHAMVAASLGAGSVEPAVNVALVVVAVPPTRAGRVVIAALQRFPSAVVTDVASVKGLVWRQVTAIGSAARNYGGSHPMAGSHRSGPLTARPDLFVERSWAVTPGDQAETSATDLVVALARSCGATVLQMSVERHDQAVAAVSHLPQIVASLMAANLTDLPTADLQLAGQGLRDVTRLAASDELMWSQIISSNRQAISGELGRLRDRLDQVLSHLDALGDMVAFIRAGQAGVSRLPGKHGLTRADYRLVVVEIPDSPGALSRLFASIGRAGINIEDISIEHDQHRQVGYLSLAVLADQQSQVEQSLVDDGWNLKV